jgi:uncharacterized protein YbjT (DUF2867 family)
VKESRLILVSGASGYVGGRLVPKLLEAGYRVRCLVRDAKRLEGYPWRKRVEVCEGDASSLSSLLEAMKDVSSAYYLIHGRQGGRADAQHDLSMARNFASAAGEAGIERIIYLGELVDPTTQLSPYLRARHESGRLLRDGAVPVTEFRAGMIVGSGSALFEMIRYLTEREPLLVCPAWFFSLAQPVAIRDVLAYLIAALDVSESVGRVIELGGPTRLTYADMLLEYARERGLKRTLIRTPFYVTLLSAYWIHLVTPIHWRVIFPLIEGLRAQLVVRDETARKLFPKIEPIDFQTALHLALGRIRRDNVETSWADALVTAMGDRRPYAFHVEEGMYIEQRRMLVEVSAQTVFRSYTGIGGERGWFYMDWAWALRGWIDKAIGGVGLRRGRRDPDEIRTGESLDFWRVEEVQKDQRLLLQAEMKVPGRAWLEFRSEPQADKTLLTVTAYFDPHGVSGFLYWYAMWPFHSFLFNGLIRRLASRARVLSHSHV